MRLGVDLSRDHHTVANVCLLVFDCSCGLLADSYEHEPPTARTPNAGNPRFRRGFCLWAHLDLNQGPHPYQGCALTNLSYEPERMWMIHQRLSSNPGRSERNIRLGYTWRYSRA